MIMHKSQQSINKLTIKENKTRGINKRGKKGERERDKLGLRRVKRNPSTIIDTTKNQKP